MQKKSRPLTVTNFTHSFTEKKEQHRNFFSSCRKSRLRLSPVHISYPKPPPTFQPAPTVGKPPRPPAQAEASMLFRAGNPLETEPDLTLLFL